MSRAVPSTLEATSEVRLHGLQGAVHAVIMQNRLRHAEEAVHNGEVGARTAFLSDPSDIARATAAARCAF